MLCSKDAAWINADIRWAIKQRYRLLKKIYRTWKKITAARNDGRLVLIEKNKQIIVNI